MGQRKKIFTALFVIFTALVSSVAGGFALLDPAKINSNAKEEGDDAVLDIKFYLNGGQGTVTDIYKKWDTSSKSDASATVDLKCPSNQSGELTFKQAKQVPDPANAYYVTDSEGNKTLYTPTKTIYEDVFDYKIIFSFSKTGYVFTEWVEGNESGPNYEKGKHYYVGEKLAENFSGNTVQKHLYAVWHPILFNISFMDKDAEIDENGKEIDKLVQTSSSVTYSSNTQDSGGNSAAVGFTMPKNTVTKPGKTFKGWVNTKTPDGGSVVYPPSTTMYYAGQIFPHKTYTLNADGNSTGEVYRDANSGTYYVNETMWAVWENTAYEVVFNMGNHGSDPGSVIYRGSKLHLPTPENDPNGYRFVQWHYETVSGAVLTTMEPLEITDPNDATKTITNPSQYRGYYYLPDDYVPDADKTKITLCAEWTANSVTVEYNSGGATGGDLPTVTTFTAGADIIFPSHTLTKPGSEFTGWDWNGDSQPDWIFSMGSLPLTQISPDTQTNTGGILRLTACWSTFNVKVEWYYNGNLDQCITDTIAYGSTAVFPDPPSKIGHTFDGWILGSLTGTVITGSGAATGYTTGKIEPADAATVTRYYAKFTITSITITYNLNLPTGTTADNAAVFTPQTIDYGSTARIHNHTPVASGQNFIGWGDKKDATIDQSVYNPNDPIYHQESVILYAIWTLPIYAIRLNPNIPVAAADEGYAASRAMDFVYLKYGAANTAAWYSNFTAPYTVTDLVTSSNHAKATLTGYTFNGFKTHGLATDVTVITANGVIADNITSTQFSSDTELYGSWTPMTYTVEFRYYSNGSSQTFSSGSPAAITGQHWNDTITLSLPQRSGYTFGGWYGDYLFSKNIGVDGEHKKISWIWGTAGLASSYNTVTLYAKFTGTPPVVNTAYAPAPATGLKYNSLAQQLLTSAYGDDEYTAYYWRGKDTDSSGPTALSEWTTDHTQITAVDAGTYRVFYALYNSEAGMLTALDNYVTVTIDKLPLSELTLLIKSLPYDGEEKTFNSVDEAVERLIYFAAAAGAEVSEAEAASNEKANNDIRKSLVDLEFGVTITGYISNRAAGTAGVTITPKNSYNNSASKNFSGDRGSANPVTFSFTIGKMDLGDAYLKKMIVFTCDDQVYTGLQIQPTFLTTTGVKISPDTVNQTDKNSPFTVTGGDVKYQYTVTGYGTNKDTDDSPNNWVNVSATADSVNYREGTSCKIYFKITPKTFELSDLAPAPDGSEYNPNDKAYSSSYRFPTKIYDGYSTGIAAGKRPALASQFTSTQRTATITVYYKRVEDALASPVTEDMTSVAPANAGKYDIYVGISNSVNFIDSQETNNYFRVGCYYISRASLSDLAESCFKLYLYASGTNLMPATVEYDGYVHKPAREVIEIPAHYRSTLNYGDYRYSDDYTVTYTHSVVNMGTTDDKTTAAGIVSVTFTGTGNYMGMKVLTYEITRSDISENNPDIEISIDSDNGNGMFSGGSAPYNYYTYYSGLSKKLNNSSPIRLVNKNHSQEEIFVGSATLNNFTVSYQYFDKDGIEGTSFINVGYITVTINADGQNPNRNYKGSISITYQIKPAPVVVVAGNREKTYGAVSAAVTPLAYEVFNGTSYNLGLYGGDSLGTPTYIIRDANGTEVADTRALPAGQYTILVHSFDSSGWNPNYVLVSDTDRHGILTVNKGNIAAGNVTFVEESLTFTFNGYAQNPTVNTIIYNSLDVTEQFSFAYFNNINAGSASVGPSPQIVLTPKKPTGQTDTNFANPLTIYYTINTFDLANADITLDTSDGKVTKMDGTYHITYTGSKLQPTVILKIGTYELGKTQDDYYTVAYGAYNTNVDLAITNEGSVTVTALGRNLKTGSQKQITFDIDRADTAELHLAFENDKSSYDVPETVGGIPFTGVDNQLLRWVRDKVNVYDGSEDISFTAQIQYKKYNAADTDYTGAVPTTAGHYMIRVTVTGINNNNYYVPTETSRRIKYLELNICSTLVVTINVATTQEVNIYVWLDTDRDNNGNYDTISYSDPNALYKGYLSVSGTPMTAPTITLSGIRGEPGRLRAYYLPKNGNADNKYNLSWNSFSNESSSANISIITPNTSGSSLNTSNNLGISSKIYLYIAQLYAVDFMSWTAFHDNNGTRTYDNVKISGVGNSDQTVYHGGYASDLSTYPSRLDWTFAGWSLSSSRANIVNLSRNAITGRTSFYAVLNEIPIVDSDLNAPTVMSGLIYDGTSKTLLNTSLPGQGGKADVVTHSYEKIYYMVSTNGDRTPSAEEMLSNNLTDYTRVSLTAENSNAGTYYIYYMAQTEGSKYVSSVKKTSVSIAQANLTDAQQITIGLYRNKTDIAAENNLTYTYDGYAHTPAQITVVWGLIYRNGGRLYDTDYTVIYSQTYGGSSSDDRINAGKIDVIITAKEGGNYTGSRTTSYSIVKANFSNAEIKLYRTANLIFPSIVEYDGTSQLPSIVDVVFNSHDNATVPAAMRSIQYYRDSKTAADFTSIGTIKVEATSIAESRNYTGTVSTTYEIIGQNANTWYVNSNVGPVYDGTAKYPASNVTLAVFNRNGDPLTLNTDYTISGSGHILVDDLTTPYKLTITPVDLTRYTGSLEVDWTIEKRTPVATDFNITGNNDTNYTGLPHTAVVFVPINSMVFGEQTVRYVGQNYNSTVPPTAAGTYRVYLAVASGANNNAFESTLMTSFTINKLNLADAVFKSTAQNPAEYTNNHDAINKTYNGTEQRQAFDDGIVEYPNIAVWVGSFKLLAADYDIHYDSNKINASGQIYDEDVTNVGTITITIIGKGNNVITNSAKTITYLIQPKNLSDATISVDAVPDQERKENADGSGIPITPIPAVYDTAISSGNALTYGASTDSGIDYYYSAYANNTDAHANDGSTAAPTIIITGKGNYTGSRTLKFAITNTLRINTAFYVTPSTQVSMNVWFNPEGSGYDTYEKTPNNLKFTIVYPYQSQYFITGLTGQKGQLMAEHLYGGADNAIRYNLTWQTPAATVIPHHTAINPLTIQPKTGQASVGNLTATLSLTQIFKVIFRNYSANNPNDNEEQETFVQYGMNAEWTGGTPAYKAANPDNYEFVGWGTDGTDTNVSFIGTVKNNIESDLTYYAKFIRKDTNYGETMVGADNLVYNSTLQSLLSSSPASSDANYTVFYMARPYGSKLNLESADITPIDFTANPTATGYTENKYLICEQAITGQDALNNPSLQAINADTYIVYSVIRSSKEPFVYSSIRTVMVTIAPASIENASVIGYTLRAGATTPDIGSDTVYGGSNRQVLYTPNKETRPDYYLVQGQLANGSSYSFFRPGDDNVSYDNVWNDLHSNNPTNAGRVTVQIRGTGNFGGLNTSYNYEIMPLDIQNATLKFNVTINGAGTGDIVTNRDGTGALINTPVIIGTFNSNYAYIPDAATFDLKYNYDGSAGSSGNLYTQDPGKYSITYLRESSVNAGTWIEYLPAYADLNSAGVIRIKITALSNNQNYMGSVWAAYQIQQQSISKWTVDSGLSAAVLYTGDSQTYYPVVKNEQGHILQFGVDYTLSNNVKTDAAGYTLQVQLLNTRDYTVMSGNVSVINSAWTISKAALTVRINDQTKVYGAYDPSSFTFEKYGLVDTDIAKQNSAIFDDFINANYLVDAGGTQYASSTATISRPVGTYPISVNNLTAKNYNITVINGSLFVTRADLTQSYAKFTLTSNTNPLSSLPNMVFNGSSQTPSFDFYVNNKKLDKADYLVTYTNKTNSNGLLTNNDANVLTDAGRVTVIVTAASGNLVLGTQKMIQYYIERTDGGTLSLAFVNNVSAYDVTADNGGIKFDVSRILINTSDGMNPDITFKYRGRDSTSYNEQTALPVTAGKYTVTAYINGIPANYSKVNGKELSAGASVEIASINFIITSKVTVTVTVNTTTEVSMSVQFETLAYAPAQTVSSNGAENTIYTFVLSGLTGSTGKIKAYITGSGEYNLSLAPNTQATSLAQIETANLSTLTNISVNLYLSEIFTVNWYEWDGSSITDKSVNNKVLYGKNSNYQYTTPVRTDWVFNGWTENPTYTNGDIWTYGTINLPGLTASNVTKDKNYYVLFREKPVEPVAGVTVNPDTMTYNGTAFHLLDTAGFAGGNASSTARVYYLSRLTSQSAPAVADIVAGGITNYFNVTEIEAGTYTVYYVAESFGRSEYSIIGSVSATIRKAIITSNSYISVAIFRNGQNFVSAEYNNTDIKPDKIDVTFYGHTTSAGGSILTESSKNEAGISLHDKDYSISYSNTYQGRTIYDDTYARDDLLKLRGIITITVQGEGNYEGFAYITYEILPADLSDSDKIILLGVDGLLYDGFAHSPTAPNTLNPTSGSRVYIGGENGLLVPAADLGTPTFYRNGTLTADLVSAGEITVVYAATQDSRNYMGQTAIITTGAKFQIGQRTLTTANIGTYLNYSTVYNSTYTGGAQPILTPSLKSNYEGLGTVTVYYNGSASSPTNYREGGYPITISVSVGSNFTAVNNLGIGTYNINKRSIGDGAINEVFIVIDYTQYSNYVFSGLPITPSYNVSHPNTTRDLIWNTDFTYAHGATGNIHAGIGAGSLILTGIGNYTGTAKQVFTITPTTLVGVTIELMSPGTVEYDGTEKKPSFAVYLGDMENGGYLLNASVSDYSVSYSNRTRADITLTNLDANVCIETGTVTVTILPNGGNFTGAPRTFTYIISPYNFANHADELKVEFSNFTAPAYKAYQYTGLPVTPSFVLTGTDFPGKLFTSADDFTTSIYKNIEAGSFAVYGTDAPHVVLSGKGNFIGDFTAYFNIVSKMTVIVNNDDVTGTAPTINIWYDVTGRETYETATYRASGNGNTFTIDGIEGNIGILKAEYTNQDTYCLTADNVTDIPTGAFTDVVFPFYTNTQVLKTDTKGDTFAFILIVQLYKINYEAGSENGQPVVYGGTKPAAQYKIHNIAYTIINNPFSRSGYTINGWNTTNTYTDAPTYTTIEDNLSQTIYANWAVKTYKIKFMAVEHPENGIAYVEVTSLFAPDITYNTLTNLIVSDQYPYGYPSTPFSLITYKAGIDYTFVGWSLMPQTEFPAIGIEPTLISLPDNIVSDYVLYAAYKRTDSAKTYSVLWKSKFYAEGDEDSQQIFYETNYHTVGSQTDPYNRTINVIDPTFVPQKFTYNGYVYTFLGWTTDEDAGYKAAVLEDDEFGRVREDITFYAVYDRMKESPY